MTITPTIVRGATMYVKVAFTDEDGEPVNPSGATLKVSYSVGSKPVVDDIAMTLQSEQWVGSWDSSPATPGRAYWFAQSNDDPKSAVEGEVIIEANSANPGS